MKYLLLLLGLLITPILKADCVLVIKSAGGIGCVPTSTFAGPAGPQGATGATGPQGAIGPQGPTGSYPAGVPCTPPTSGITIYAQRADGQCEVLIVVPAPGFQANNIGVTEVADAQGNMNVWSIYMQLLPAPTSPVTPLIAQFIQHWQV